jgi:hypothetical protein
MLQNARKPSIWQPEYSNRKRETYRLGSFDAGNSVAEEENGYHLGRDHDVYNLLESLQSGIPPQKGAIPNYTAISRYNMHDHMVETMVIHTECSQ